MSLYSILSHRRVLEVSKRRNEATKPTDPFAIDGALLVCRTYHNLTTQQPYFRRFVAAGNTLTLGYGSLIKSTAVTSTLDYSRIARDQKRFP